MERKSWKLWIIAVILMMTVCIAIGAATADEFPTNPYQEEVWKIDRASQQIGKRGAEGYWMGVNWIKFEEIQAPSLTQHGIWQITMENKPEGLGEVTHRAFVLQSLDPNGEYTTEYRFPATTSDTIESCDFVAPGRYRLIVDYDFENQANVIVYNNEACDAGFSNHLDITITREAGQTAQDYPTVQEKAEQIARACQSGNDWQTALNLHDWLTHHAYYDKGYSFYGAEDVLFRGKGVCDSYAKAFLLLCQKAGIPSKRVTGTAYNKTGSESHAWNAIRLDGEWYLVDTTWDDPSGNSVPVSGEERYDYFCLNDDLMGLNHVNDGQQGFSNGQCNSLEANYLLRTNDRAALGDEYIENNQILRYSDKILEKLNAQQTTFQIPCNDELYENIKINGDSLTYSPYTWNANQYRGADAKRKWSLLAMSLSRTPFTLSNNERVYVSVNYDRTNNRFDCETSGLSLLDKNGNNVSTLTGQYYYKIYIGLPDHVRQFEVGFGSTTATAPEDKWIHQVNWLQHDTYGDFFLVVAPEDGTQSETMFARINEGDEYKKVTIQYDRSKVVNNTTATNITNTNNPTILSPFTLTWSKTNDNDEWYLIDWVFQNGGDMMFDCGETQYKIGDYEEELNEALSYAGEYEARVTVLNGGYRYNYPSKKFTAAAPQQSGSAFTISCERESETKDGVTYYPMLLHESVDFDIVYPATTGDVELFGICGNDIEWPDTDPDQPGKAGFHWTAHQTGDWFAFARMKVNQNGEEQWIYSNTLRMRVKMDDEATLGDVTYTLPDYPNANENTVLQIPQNGTLKINVNNIGADFYGAYLTDPGHTSEREGDWYTNTHWVIEQSSVGVGYTQIHLPANGCEPEKQYEVHVYAVKYGVDMKEATAKKKIQVTARTDVQQGEDPSPIIISMSDSYVVSSAIGFNVRYVGEDEAMPPQSWLKVVIYKKGDPDDIRYERDGDAYYFWETDCRIGLRGTYVLKASILQEGPNGHPSTVWTNEKEFTVQPSNEANQLMDPEFTTPVAGLMSKEQSKAITFDYKAPGAEHSSVEIMQLNDWGGYTVARAEIQLAGKWKGAADGGLSIKNYGEENEYIQAAFSFPDGLSDGQYGINICADKYDYDTSFAWASFTVLEGYVQSDNVTLTVNGETSVYNGTVGIPAYLVIEAPGATALRLFNGNEWDYLDYQGDGYYEDRISIEDGSQTYIAQATYVENPEQYDKPDQIPWSAYSNAVTVNGSFTEWTARPTVTLEGLDNNGQIERGKTLTVVINAPADQEEGTTYGARRFSVHIETENGERCSNNYYVEDVSVPLRVGMSTGWYHADGTKYKVVVDAQEPGKNWCGAASSLFTVKEKASGTNIGDKPTLDLVANKDTNNVYHVLRGERVQLLGTAPGASSVDIVMHNTLDSEDTRYDVQNGHSEYHDDDDDADPTDYVFNDINESLSQLEPGTYKVYAKACYSNGMEPQNSNELTVQIELASGALTTPVISVDSVITPDDPEDETDATTFSFTVANLEDARVGHWEVLIEEQDKWNQPAVYRRTSQGQITRNAKGEAVFTVKKSLLTEGTKYRIVARVDGDGYETIEGQAQIVMMTVTANPLVTVSVNGKTDTAEVPVKREFVISVTADRSVTAICIEKGESRSNPDVINDGHAQEKCTIDDPETRPIYVRYSTDKNVPWAQEGFSWNGFNWNTFDWSTVKWDGISNVVTVQATSSGTMPKVASYTIEPTICTVAQGQPLTITIGDDPEGYADTAIYYYADVYRARQEWNGYNWSEHENHIDWNGDSREIVIPTYRYTPGRYRIKIGMGADGYTDSGKDLFVWITEASSTIKPIEFTTSKTTAKANEDITLTLYAQGADRTKVEITRADDADWSDQRENYGEQNVWTWSADEPGTYTLTPVSIKMGNPDVKGTPVTVTISETDKELNEPVLEMDGIVRVGTGLTVNVTATGTIAASGEQAAQTVAAKKVILRLFNVTNGGGYQMTETDVRPNANGTASYTFEPGYFQDGQIYVIEANSMLTDWIGGHARKLVAAISGNVNPQKTVTLTITAGTETYSGVQTSPIEIPSSKVFHLQAEAQGAYAIRILKGNRWETRPGNSFEDDWSFEKGAYTITAMASYDDPSEITGIGKSYAQFEDADWRNFNWNTDVSWTGISNVFALKVVSNGALGEPSFTLSGLDENNCVVRGTPITVTIGDDPDGIPNGLNYWYYASADRGNTSGESNEVTNWWHEERWNWPWNGGNRTITIPTYSMEPGVYRLQVGIDAEGWDANIQDAGTFTVTNPSSAFVHDIPTTMPVNSEQMFHVLIPGASRIKTQVNRKNDSGTYEAYWQESDMGSGDSAEFMLGINEAGYFQVAFYAAMEEGAESELVGTTEFTTTSAGTFEAEPEINMTSPWTSGNLRFSVIAENGAHVYVNIGDGTENGMNLHYEDLREFDIDGSKFADNKDYWIWVNQSKEGYIGNGRMYLMRRIGENKTLKLPTGLRTLETEAFKGVSAEMVIIPSGVTKIEADTFADCPSLKAVVIPTSVTQIDSSAFRIDQQYRSLTIYGSGETAKTFAQNNGFDYISIASGN